MYPARNLRSLRKTAARALPLDGRGREAPKNLHHPQCPRRRPLSPHTPCLTLGGDPRLPDHLVGDMGEGGLPPPPELAGDLVQQPPPPPGGDREFRAGGSGGGGRGNTLRAGYSRDKCDFVVPSPQKQTVWTLSFGFTGGWGPSGKSTMRFIRTARAAVVET